jgi:hypothetical protein
VLKKKLLEWNKRKEVLIKKCLNFLFSRPPPQKIRCIKAGFNPELHNEAKHSQSL